MYKRGDIFTRTNIDDELEYYSLAHVDTNNKMTLICISDGERWSNAVVVENIHNISENEFEKISDEGVFTKFSGELKLVIS